MRHDPRLGILLVLAAACFWGTTGTAQHLSGAALSGPWFGALRLVVAALFFAAVAAWVRRSAPAPGSAPKGAFVGAGVAMAVYNLAFFEGLRHTGIALGTAIALGSGPIWAGLIEALVLRRRLSGGWWVGTLLAITGGALMAGVVGRQGSSIDAAGVALCLLSGLAYALYALVTKRLASQVPASTVTFRAFAIAALVALPFAAFDAGRPRVGVADAVAVLYVGVFTAGVAYLLFAEGLKHVSASTGVTLALFEPVVACLLAALVIGEPVGPAAWAGLALVLAGVLVVTRAEWRAATLARPRSGAPAAGG